MQTRVHIEGPSSTPSERRRMSEQQDTVPDEVPDYLATLAETRSETEQRLREQY